MVTRARSRRTGHRARQIATGALAVGATLAAVAVAVTAAAASAASPAYYPSGPQRDVTVTTVTDGDWTQCFSQHYDAVGPSVASVLDGCQGKYLLLAARPIASPTFDLLAAAPREDVVFETGNPSTNPDGYNTPHDANGSGWYFNDRWSWGFAKQGDPINRYACDYDPTVNVALRLCWHTFSGELGWGYRSGETLLNDGSGWERSIFVSDGAPRPTTIRACKNDGWKSYGDTFRNQGACVRYVAEGGDEQ